jgi:uncharacterized protein YcbX
MTSTQRVLGSVVSLWRYPVKYMMGEEVNASEATKFGLLGDRVYTLVDSSDGKFASAKNPRKWPTLFNFRGALGGGSAGCDGGSRKASCKHQKPIKNRT